MLKRAALVVALGSTYVWAQPIESSEVHGSVRVFPDQPFEVWFSIDSKAQRRTDASGEFSATGLAPGRHLIELRESGLKFLDVEVDLVERQVLRLPPTTMFVANSGCGVPARASRIRYTGEQRSGAIRGDIRRTVGAFRGGPLGGVQVSLASPGAAMRQLVTSANGKFVFSGLVPGRYRIQFQASGFHTEEFEIDVIGSFELVFEDGWTLDRCVTGDCSKPKPMAGSCE